MSSLLQPGSGEATFFMNEIQRELVARGKAEEVDNTMAEYILVMMLNNKSPDAIEAELRDLQGDEFDPSFTPWLFTRAEAIQSGRLRPSAPTSIAAQPVIISAPPPVEVLPAPQPIPTLASATAPSRAINGNSRLLSNALAPIASGQRGPAPLHPSNALAGTKRGFSPVSGNEAYNKRRSLGNGTSAPSGPRSMQAGDGVDEDGDLIMDGVGQRGALANRIGGKALNPGAGEFAVGGGMRGGRGGIMGGRGGGRNPAFMHRNGLNPQQQFMGMQHQQMMNGGRFGMQPSSAAEALAMQEVMRQQQEQMFAMQITMNQMVQAVQSGVLPSPAPAPVTSQPPQKLGSHTISGRRPGPPAGSTLKSPPTVGSPPEKPLSTELCKFGVGCTSARCTFSHPSPVATMLSGMVLRTEACPKMKACDDPDCSYSHVSPAQKHGESAGVSRVMCKFPVCTNPSCQYRHEDASGILIPPPAQTRTASSSGAAPAVDIDDHEDLDVRMDSEATASGLAAGSKTPMTAEQRQAMLNSPLGDTIAARGSSTSKPKPKAMPNKPLNGTIQVACKFGAGCTNKQCKFIHDARKQCHFGAKCFKEDCSYAHPTGRITTSSTLSGDSFRPYKGGEPSATSQRKFQVDSDGPVEKIIPGVAVAGGKGVDVKVVLGEEEGGQEVEEENRVEEAIKRGEAEVKME